MSGELRQFKALVHKDLMSELRGRQTALLLFSLGLLLSAVFASGITNAFLPPPEIRSLYPVVLWAVFVVSATIAVGRSLDYEQSLAGLEALFFTGTPGWLIFASKCLVVSLLMLIVQVFQIIALSVLLNVDLSGAFGGLVLISVPVIIGYSALAILLAGVASTSRLKDLLVPIILIPLLFPLLFAATELSGVLLLGESLIGSPWLTLLLIVSLVYLLLGINLFEYILQE